MLVAAKIFTHRKPNSPGTVYILLACMFLLMNYAPAVQSAGFRPDPMTLQAQPILPKSNNVYTIASIGAEAENIMEIQSALKTLGFYSGRIDGIVGRGTGFAILRFYRAAGYNIGIATLARGLSTKQMLILLSSAHMINGRGMSLEQALAEFPAFEKAYDTDNRAQASIAEGHFLEAEQLFRDAYREYSRLFGVSDRFSLIAAYGRGNALLRLGNTFEAEKILRNTLRLQKTSRGIDHPETLATEQSLALVSYQKGKYSEAEVKMRKNLVTVELLLGMENTQTLDVMNNLAVTISAQGRFREAEALFEEYLSRTTAAYGETEVKTITAMGNLSAIKRVIGKLNEAEALAENALRIANNKYGTDHIVTSRSVVQLASAKFEQGRFADSESLLMEVLPRLISAQGLGSIEVANARMQLARVFIENGEFARAEAYARDARDVFFASGVPWSAEILTTSLTVADALSGQGILDLSEREYRKVFNQIDDFLAEFASIPETNASTYQDPIAGYFALQEKKAGAGDVSAANSFEIQSWWTFSKIDVSMNDLGSRFLLRNDDDLALLRTYQELRENAAGLRASYSIALQQGLDSAERRALSDNLTAAENRLSTIQKVVFQKLPDVSELLLPRAITATETQALLQPGEGLVAYASTKNRLYAWLLKPDGIQWHGVDVSREKLADRVLQLRKSVDLSQPAPTLRPLGNCAVESAAPMLEGRWFDACASKDLFDDLLGGFDLSGIEHLIVAPDGPLETIPFSLLVSGFDVDGEPRWLIDDKSISRIPTTASLRALRAKGIARSGLASKPFLGIAPGSFSDHATNSPLSIVPPELPATVLEVRLLAKILDAGNAGIVAGSGASEAFVENADLSDYRVISFATHGLMTRETEKWTNGAIAEPALVLSGAGDVGDGLLTASEAARLQLNADWVLLSGCNTASGTSDGAKGLSGLAKAFFFAGAKSLLVSHWSIEDSSAFLLMTRAMEFSTPDQPFSKAAALQSAILGLKNTDRYAHPYFWAPFELVGEGRGGTKLGGEPLLLADASSTAFLAAQVELSSLEPVQFLAKPALRGSMVNPGDTSPELRLPGSEITESALSLSRTERIELQRRLNIQGYDTKGVDGVFGPNSRDAISLWQQGRDFPTTGYFSESQVVELRKNSEQMYQEWLVANPNNTRNTRRPVRRCTNFGLFKICNTR